MKIKTGELIGAALDWAVGKCEENEFYKMTLRPRGYGPPVPFMQDICPSTAGGGYYPLFYTDWRHGGPIIERERLTIFFEYTDPENPSEYTWIANPYDMDSICQRKYGPTPLIAAMRCYVTSKLGSEIDVPNELVKEN